MGDVIKRRLSVRVLIIGAIFFILTAALSVLSVTSVLGNAPLRLLRLDLNALVSGLERVEPSDYAEKFGDDYRFSVISLNGTVLFCNDGRYSEGERVSLHTLGTNEADGLFLVPLVRDGAQFALLSAEYDRCAYTNIPLVVIAAILPFLLLAAAGIFGLGIKKILKNDVFAPVDQLHSATESIISGDMETPLLYDYDGAVGELCHDFEIMREQLSESMRREKELRESEKVLLASISHDLKTPLAAIIGYTDGLMLGVVTDEAGTKHYAERIKAKAETLADMIDDILEHTKAELSQLSVETEDVYSAEYFAVTAEEFLSDARQKGFLTACGEIPDVLLSLDPKRTAQVMQNIIGNSVKYGRAGGKIEVGFTLAEHELIVSVRDNGSGIAAADLPFVFDRFYRGDKARTQSIPGSGLGLSIAKYIVEKQGGRIECDSVLGAGTVISFSVPY